MSDSNDNNPKQESWTGEAGEAGTLRTESNTISGTVFLDEDANQTSNGGPVIHNLNVTITGPVNRIGESVSRPLHTEIDGRYGSGFLSDGSYEVEFQPSPISVKLDSQPNLSTPVVSVINSTHKKEQAFGLIPNEPEKIKTLVQIKDGKPRVVNYSYKFAPSCIYGRICVKGSHNEYACDKSITPRHEYLEGVPIALFSCGGKMRETVSNHEGYWEFKDVPFGGFTIEFPSQFAGKSLAPAQRKIRIPYLLPGSHYRCLEVCYNGVHQGIIRGKVILEDGSGLPHILLRLTDKTGISGEQPFHTGRDGSYEVPVQNGTYEISVDDAFLTSTTLQARTDTQLTVVVDGEETVQDIIFGLPAPFNTFANQFKQLVDAKITCCAPTATQSSSTSLPALTGATGGLAFDQVVDLGFARILGARLSDDPKIIAKQLASSFVKETRNGKDYYVLQTRGTTPLNNSQGRQITGRQATAFQQAKDIEQSARRLLDAVETLLLDPDEEEIDSLKENIRSNLADLVAEFGRNGGALTQRGDVLISNLQQDIADLRIALGMTVPIVPEREMDVAEIEQDVENFKLLENYINSQLATAWNSYKAGVATFSGTILTRLLWTAEAIVDTVKEVYAVMDSVGFGPVDRRVTMIGTGPTTIEQLLLWIETSASNDWPRHLTTGGARKTEIKAIGREASSQNIALQALITQVKTSSVIIPIGGSRVLPALEELQRELQQVINLVNAI